MAWIQDLYQTYKNCEKAIGGSSHENEVSLLPVYHTTQMAQIEITIDAEGKFRRARVVPKPEARTIIPCTESSGGRTSGEAPHPLCDKLQYIAKDYPKWGGRKKPYFDSYQTQLETWCASGFAHSKATAVLKYVKKGAVVKDLVDSQVLIAGKDGKLLQKWTDDGDKPKIFEGQIAQDDSFVRWEVETSGDVETRVWQDPTLWKSWENYYTSTKIDEDFCYVTGEIEILADQHLAKIRHDGDKAKLISANDASGFTFRGRFIDAKQAATIGAETSQMAHLALRWLISRQGYRKDDQAVVAWAISGKEVPQPLDDLATLLGFDDLPEDKLPTVDTAQEISLQLKKRLAGYGQALSEREGVVVMALDSATPGRMAITFYRKLNGSEFLEQIDTWHDTCRWLHHYGTSKIQDQGTGKMKTRRFTFIGAPSPADIAEAAYGQRVDGKLRKHTVERILPCIVDGQAIPRDLVESAIRRASNRTGKDYWEWNKTLTIACALFKKSTISKEDYDVALDPNRKTRDYLYGRLLALAESLETWALNQAGERRETNAARLMQRFAERPFSTWRTIELALSPYKARLGAKSSKRQRLIDEVVAAFKDEDFLSDKRLSGEFLLGYHAQREDLRSGTKPEEDSPEYEDS